MRKPRELGGTLRKKQVVTITS